MLRTSPDPSATNSVATGDESNQPDSSTQRKTAVASYAQRRARTAAFLRRYDLTAERLRAMALGYEAEYRECCRAGGRGISRPHLFGMLQTARVFYSLARGTAR